MRVYGIDFTSVPSWGKPITCLACELDGDTLTPDRLLKLRNFKKFEAALRKPWRWIAGLDFPFGQPKKLVEGRCWPGTWEGYVDHVGFGSMKKEVFEGELNDYKKGRPKGNRHHLRIVDRRARAVSPQTLHGVPVGKMFFQGARRLLLSGVHIPGIHEGDPNRIAVEAYPGVLARQFIGSCKYKNGDPSKQTLEQYTARKKLLAALSTERLPDRYDGLRLSMSRETSRRLASDPSGDMLDALLCAIQAAWAYRNLDRILVPDVFDPLEGWIADPVACGFRDA